MSDFNINHPPIEIPQGNPSNTPVIQFNTLSSHQLSISQIQMFVLYKISQEIAISPQQYRLSLSKATKAKVFEKYLYKICFSGICIKINRIQIIDNVLLRKDAQILVILEVELLLVKFIQDEYFEGVAKEFDQNGIVVSFMNGLLEGRILPAYLHQRTIFNFAEKKEKDPQHPQNEEKNQLQQMKDQKQKQLIGKWILPYDSKKAFTWKLNEKVRFKIQSTNWQKQNQSRFADLIFLRADEEGLGPASWWI